MPHLTLNIWSFDTAFVVSTQTLHGSLYVSICQLLLHFFISQLFSSVEWKKNSTYFLDMFKD